MEGLADKAAIYLGGLFYAQLKITKQFCLEPLKNGKSASFLVEIIL